LNFVDLTTPSFPEIGINIIIDESAEMIENQTVTQNSLVLSKTWSESTSDV